MKRIDVHYAGHLYSIGGREFDDVRREVSEAQDSGAWMVVNDGEGSRRDAYIWLSGGTPIALIPIPSDD
jgi:hypothetical protein